MGFEPVGQQNEMFDGQLAGFPRSTKWRSNAGGTTSVDGLVWQQWKRGTTRYRELRKRGIAAQEAAQTAGSSDGPWHLANTPALKLALSNAYFASLGLPELTAHD